MSTSLLSKLKLQPGQRICFYPIVPEEFDKLAIETTWSMELTANGEMIVMAPTGGDTGRKNSRLTSRLDRWNEEMNLGEVFDSSTMFILPNGSRRGPDVAWVSRDRWNELNPEEKAGFPPLCPDFIIELRSRTDTLSSLRTKMQEYRENGCRLGWLINPQDRQVEIYRVGEIMILNHPEELRDEEILPGFVLDLQTIF